MADIGFYNRYPLPFFQLIMIKLNTNCIECGSNQVYYDKRHFEIYCRKCGLVLVQLNKIPNDNLFLDYNFNDFKEVWHFYLHILIMLHCLLIGNSRKSDCLFTFFFTCKLWWKYASFSEQKGTKRNTKRYIEKYWFTMNFFIDPTAQQWNRLSASNQTNRTIILMELLQSQLNSMVMW